MVTFGVVTPTVAIIVLVIALIIFGPGKLPELGKGLGKGIKEFKDATDLSDDKKEKKEIAESKKETKTESKAEEPESTKE